MQRGVHMSMIIYKTVITFLVVYAVIEMISKFIVTLKKRDKKEIYIFVHVKNQEDSIEFIIRTAIINYLSSYGGRIVPYIVIVDKGSEDRTEEISRKLCSDYDFVYYTTEETYEEFKREINRQVTK